MNEQDTNTQFHVALPQTGPICRICVSARRSRSASIRSAPFASRLRRCALKPRTLHFVPRARGSRCCCSSHRRWSGSLGLIVLPHIDLAVLSLRTRVAPRVYEWSLDKYRTFIDEPLYWHTFVRTALMSILRHGVHAADRVSDRVVHREDCARPREVGVVRPVPDSVLGQRDRAHAGLDDPAARVRRDPGSRWFRLGWRGTPPELSTTTRRFWSASSTRRCCSWSCR